MLFSRWRVLAAVVLLAGATATGCGEAGATITRLTVGAPGADPYTLVSGSSDQQVSAPRPQSGGQTSGDSPGLYGGTRQAASCDPAKLLQFLQANPDKARAWAKVHGIGTADIEAFLGKLTPVTLRVDTLVTNHGYKDGQPTDIDAVLQAGMGVLVDAYGTPVVKCNCGNPLTAANKKIKPRKAKYTGQTWPQFSDRKVTIVKPRDKAKGPVESFTLVDPAGTMAFTRPMGTMGGSDGPPGELPPTETPGPTDTATPSVSPSDSSSPGTDPTGGTDPSPSESTSPGEGDPTPGEGEGGGDTGNGSGTTDPPLGEGQAVPSPQRAVPEPGGGVSALPRGGDPGTGGSPPPD